MPIDTNGKMWIYCVNVGQGDTTVIVTPENKVIIIDGQIVVTGSYNFSKSAKTRNDENTLILHSPEIAELYFDEFERVWGIAEN